MGTGCSEIWELVYFAVFSYYVNAGRYCVFSLFPWSHILWCFNSKLKYEQKCLLSFSRFFAFFYAQDSEGESKSSCVHMGGFNILPEEKHLIYMFSTSPWLPLEVILLLCHFSG